MKKTLCALLVLVMVLGLLAGCVKPVDPTTTNKPAGTNPGQEITKPTESKEWTEEGYLPFANGETLTIGTSQASVVEDYNNSPMTLWVEKMTGVNVEFVFFPGEAGEKQQKFGLMIAGEEKLPDVVMTGVEITTQLINEYGADGYIVDLQKYIGDMNYTPYITQALAGLSDTMYNRTMIKIRNPETGAIYQTPWASDVVAYDNTQTIGWINQKWLDAVGMKAPTTVDELHDVLVAFRDKDPNGNNKADEIPMIGPLNSGGANMLGLLINAYVYMDFDNHFNATDGKLWTPWTTEAYREALKTLNAWYKEGLIAQQSFTGLTYEETKPIYTPEDAVAVCGVMAGHPSVYMTKNNEAFLEYVPLAPLAGETDQGGYMVNRPGAVYDGCFITTDCENVELAIRFLDFFFRDESVATVRHGEKGVHWDWMDPNETDPNVKNIKVLADCNDPKYWGWGYGIAICNSNNYMNAATREGWSGYKDECQYQIEEWMAEAKVPEEVVQNFLFTASEQEAYNSKTTRFTDYITEALAKFGTGVWDPNSDADWDTYLKELDTMGLADYVATAQSGYDSFLDKYGK